MAVDPSASSTPKFDEEKGYLVANVEDFSGLGGHSKCAEVPQEGEGLSEAATMAAATGVSLVSDTSAESGDEETKPLGPRPIVIIKWQREYYALDNHCYHAGGPLSNGDIEDMDGHPTVKCPWHRYIIDFRTGEGLYYGYDKVKKKKSEHLKSKGKKQRVHQVTVDEDTGDIWVKLNTDPIELDSDQYARVMKHSDDGITIRLAPKKKKKAGIVITKPSDP